MEYGDSETRMRDQIGRENHQERERLAWAEARAELFGAVEWAVREVLVAMPPGAQKGYAEDAFALLRAIFAGPPMAGGGVPVARRLISAESIVQRLAIFPAERESAADRHMMECVFCDGREAYDGRGIAFEHEPDCLYARAQAHMEARASLHGWE